MSPLRRDLEEVREMLELAKSRLELKPADILPALKLTPAEKRAAAVLALQKLGIEV